MDKYSSKILNEGNLDDLSGHETASYLILSELLSMLVRAGSVNLTEVHDLLNTVGNRLSCIREDLAEMGFEGYGKRLEHEGQHLINLIGNDVEISTRFLRKHKAG
jgi:hypothetical protein